MLCALALPVAAQTMVEVPGPGLTLRAQWSPAAAARAPALVLLHGCGGAFDTAGRPVQRMREYAALLNQAGWHVLVLDSFGPRGTTEICTQPLAQRKVKQAQRREDALAALAWLAARADVDAHKLALLGWSNGGSTVLAASNLAQPEVAAAAPRPAALVAFYPGCVVEQQRGYRPSAPLLLLVGDSDDWTPAAPCRALQAEAAAPAPRLVSYAGAHHGFDSRAPVRLRRDVPNGVNAGVGVHVGGDPAARADAQRQLLDFLRQHLR